MSCYDCNRADMMRRAIAQAGKGLPDIEPGMPLPAGTGLTRRQFVSRGIKQRRMDTALQLVGLAPCTTQHVGYAGNVARLAGMAGAKQGHLPVREPEALDAPGSDQWHGLQRLQSTARHRHE